MCEEELETRRVWCGERTAGLLVVVVCLLLPKVPAHCSSGHRHPIMELGRMEAGRMEAERASGSGRVSQESSAGEGSPEAGSTSPAS